MADKTDHDHADRNRDKTKAADRLAKIDAETHRQLLNHLNAAVRPEDLVHGLPDTRHAHPRDPHPEHAAAHGHDHELTFMREDAANQLLEFRNLEYPLGFRHWRELERFDRFVPDWLDDLIILLGPQTRGKWNDFPLDIPRRGNGSRDGVVHAALLKNGKVLFITADETTLLWNPEDASPATFEDPANQPHTMPGGYSVLCGHHVQMSDEDGSIFAVGGGGYGPNALAKAAYIYNPQTNTWARSANDMANAKWYPTAVSLGGNRILVVAGRHQNAEIEVFNEVSRTFSPISGDTFDFPNTYPGLHILPNNMIFYSRTGFGTAGAGPGGTAYDDDTVNPQALEGKRSAYLELDLTAGSCNWTKIATSPINRTKGFSVMLHSSTPPHARIMVVGGSDPTSNDTYEIIDISTMMPTAHWEDWEPVPDGQNRALPSGVLLPDGKLFICGGISTTNSPCTMYNPQTDGWSAMASLPSVRQYHSVALLLPSGQVMMAGWNNPKIEIFSPPYMFKGARPQITDAPEIVHHGSTFTIECTDPCEITKVVLVRPIAVTHQTDSEQRVIEMLPKVYNPAQPDRLTLTAPDGGHPHPMAPRGNYMMFAVDNRGVPSVARWIYLH